MLAVNSIRVDQERSSGLVKGISLGAVAPGVTALKTIYLTNTGGAGDRILDISIQSHVPGAAHPASPLPSAEEDTPRTGSTDTSETLQTLVIPTAAPIKVEYDVTYMRSQKPLPALTDLDSYEGDYWDEGIGGSALVRAKLVCSGPHGISVERVRLVRKVCRLCPVHVLSRLIGLSYRMGRMREWLTVRWMQMKMTSPQVRHS